METNQNKRRKKVILLDGKAESYRDLAETLLHRALENPELGALMGQAARDPNMNNQTLLATGFTFGVFATIAALHHGEIKQFPRG